MTTIKESSRAHLTLVLVFHVIPRRAFVGDPRTIPYTSVKYGGVSSNSTIIEATKFASLHNQTCSLGPDDRSLIDLGMSYHQLMIRT
jgi:hypothetical protein